MLAKEHYPEFRLVTKNIEEVYEKVSRSHPEFLHLNLKVITLRPCTAKEFALKDNQVGVVIQEWEILLLCFYYCKGSFAEKTD